MTSDILDAGHKCKNGPHSHVWSGPGTEHTTFVSGKEEVTDPVNWSYVKNYFAPCDDPDCRLRGKPVKWYGSGTLTYEPDLAGLESFRDGLYSWGSLANVAVGASGKGPRLQAAAPNEDAWLVFRIDSPYVIADAVIEGSFLRTRDADVNAVSISVDKGDNWQQIWTNNTIGRTAVKLNVGRELWDANKPSVTGQYSWLVRIEFRRTGEAAEVGLDKLRITSFLHLNMFTLPMLQAGANPVRFSAKSIEPGESVRVTFCWDDLAGKERKDVKTFVKTSEKYVITTKAEKPDDITMRWLLLENPVAGR
jgi:hypothetical protein